MASVSKRTRNGNVTYWVRWRDPEGNQKSKTFTRKTGPGGADEFRAELETKLNRGSYVDSKAGSVAMSEWVETWLETQSHLKESTRVRYEGLARTHILGRWSKTPINKVTHADIAKWVKDLDKSHSASSVRQAHRVLSLILEMAVRDNRLPSNPAKGISVKPDENPEPVFLSPAELALIVKKAGSRGLEIKFLALTGVRFGEMAALTIERVDLERRRIRVVESATEVAGTLVTSTPKNHRKRTVPIPKNLADDLKKHIGTRTRGFVFLTPQGQQLRLNNWRRDVFAKAIGHLDITPHDLRHTAASLAISKGANPKAVQKMLGHQSAAMTMDIYAGLFPDDLETVAEAMDSIDVPLYSSALQSDPTPEQSPEVEQQD